MPLTSRDVPGASRPIPEVFKVQDATGELWDWRLKGANGEIVCSSGQGFTSQHDAAAALLRAAELFEYVPNLEIRVV